MKNHSFEIPTQPVGSPGEWRSDLILSDRWHREIEPEPGAELIQTTESVLSKSLSASDCQVSQFNEPRLHPLFLNRYRNAEPGAIRGGYAPSLDHHHVKL